MKRNNDFWSDHFMPNAEKLSLAMRPHEKSPNKESPNEESPNIKNRV